ncbi:hypothetical protein EUTSA_v10017718mg, partial [Eutrema salsugineum]
NSLDYYLPPGADLGQVISTVFLEGPNYERWAKLLRNALKAKNKLCFIDGNVKQPSSGADEIKLWGIINSMLLWQGLKDQFSVGNEPPIYELKVSLATSKQESHTVQEYFGCMKRLWDDLIDYELIPACCFGQSNCETTKTLTSLSDRQRKYHFLMGLDGTRLGTTWSNILCMQPSPNLQSTFNMIIQEENIGTMRTSFHSLVIVLFSLIVDGLVMKRKYAINFMGSQILFEDVM